ncbi:MAG: GAF domain-containing protein [Longimicrobiales bacterium]|nr:GAF domain-containing protein [Longimicrobiales bacterium]
MQSEVAGNETRGAPTHSTELALVGELSLLLDGARDLAPLDRALQRLREFTAADACDLFLTHPDGSELFLVSHMGGDGEAFGQQARFRLGEGFPGIVLQTATPVWTRHLPDEIDFLRSRVKALGYRSVACVPLLSGGTVEGCVLLAWRDSKRNLSRTVRTLTLAVRPLATGVELIRARLLTEAGRSGSRAVGHEAISERLRSSIPTDSVRLIPAGEHEGNGAFAPCPACADGSVQVLGGRTGWPGACVEAGCSAKARYCVGVGPGAAGWTVATLAFRERAPVPLTRHVPTALWLATSCDSRSANGEGARGALSGVQSHAHLEIRCMGRFEVLVDGRPVRHQRFGRSKAIELLALLASVARPVAFEELERSLWPDADASRTRNRLHVTLSALRSAVEGERSAASAHIRRDGRYYLLDRHSSVEVDLWRFQELLNVASASLRGRGASTDAALLQEAIALCQGNLFGGSFTGDWAHGVEQRVRAQLHWASERLDRIDVPGPPVPGIHHDAAEAL